MFQDGCINRYDLTDLERPVIAPLPPNKPKRILSVDNWRVLSDIFWVLLSGTPWRATPERYGSRATCDYRFVSLRRVGPSDGWNHGVP